jgi:hypothetical protein
VDGARIGRATRPRDRINSTARRIAREPNGDPRPLYARAANANAKPNHQTRDATRASDCAERNTVGRGHMAEKVTEELSVWHFLRRPNEMKSPEPARVT